jgi:nucleoside-diphosphate-sugar epimerase
MVARDAAAGTGDSLMRTALVFGGSGQIGAPLLQRLLGAQWRVLAISRAAQTDADGVHWLRGDCDGVDGLPAAVDAIFSCGPLDHFARWYAASPVACARVVAFGSTSVAVKHDSGDAHERDLAMRLRAAEDSLFTSAREQGAAVTVLRPTLVYGSGRDRTLSRIAALARRFGAFVLPRGASGLRQPAHADDLADAALAALDAEAAHGNAYDLPGGEALPYREMVARVLAALQPPARLIEVPAPVFTMLLSVARTMGRLHGFGDAALARMREDLVFDGAPAQRDFGYAPRKFAPMAGMFEADPRPL